MSLSTDPLDNKTVANRLIVHMMQTRVLKSISRLQEEANEWLVVHNHGKRRKATKIKKALLNSPDDSHTLKFNSHIATMHRVSEQEPQHSKHQ